MQKGISDQGFTRLAHFVHAQAWGGDVLVVTSTKWYIPSEGESNTKGSMFDFSDGARGYFHTEDFNDVDRVIVTTQGQTLIESEQVEGSSSAFDAYAVAHAEYMGSAPQGVMSMAEQEEFNSVLGTNFETFEPSEEETQKWSESMGDLAMAQGY